MICVYDFEGYTEIGHFPVSVWADWDPESGLLYFGGGWNISPIYTNHEPTEAEVLHLYKIKLNQQN